MSANTNQLLKELKNIKTANENLTILNNNLLVIERQKEEKDSMAKRRQEMLRKSFITKRSVK